MYATCTQSIKNIFEYQTYKNKQKVRKTNKQNKKTICRKPNCILQPSKVTHLTECFSNLKAGCHKVVTGRYKFLKQNYPKMRWLYEVNATLQF